MSLDFARIAGIFNGFRTDRSCHSIGQLPAEGNSVRINRELARWILVRSATLIRGHVNNRTRGHGQVSDCVHPDKTVYEHGIKEIIAKDTNKPINIFRRRKIVLAWRIYFAG